MSPYEAEDLSILISKVFQCVRLSREISGTVALVYVEGYGIRVDGLLSLTDGRWLTTDDG